MIAKAPALPTTKREKIIYLLDHWDEIHDPDAASPQGRPGGGTNTPHLAFMASHVSVRELARCLAVLREVAPVQHSHLMAFHGAEWRQTRTPKRTTVKGKTGWISNPRSSHAEDWDHGRERIVPAWVRLEKVRRAQEALAEAFRGQVFIPDDLWDALTLSSVEVDAKEARRRGRRIAA